MLVTFELDQAELDAVVVAAEKANITPEAYVRHAVLRMAAQDARLPTAALSAERSPSRRSLRPPRYSAVMPVHEIVRQLTAHLGIQLLSITLGADADAIRNWAEEKNPLPGLYERRLRAAHESWQLVCVAESPQTARAWWMGMKDGLADISPAEAIALDRYDDVRAVARYFVEAG
ncbi:hypothetical protein AA0Z99_00100 [Agrococcus sp. 1P02AA]|uniref:hypothetical protein n=1 Tax=Agrococcus sp. 1P02AA TaxID=3132259 RepID=UPI0039A56F23